MHVNDNLHIGGIYVCEAIYVAIFFNSNIDKVLKEIAHILCIILFLRF